MRVIYTFLRLYRNHVQYTLHAAELKMGDYRLNIRTPRLFRMVLMLF